jgi:hypothetical protein
MTKNKLFAVITGDIAGSSRLEGENRKKLLSQLKLSFDSVEEILGKDVMAYPFEIFRGDSFQGVLNFPELSLKAALIIRALIRSSFKTTLKDAFDARIAIGIGEISLLPDGSGGEGDGEAYRNSGPELDRMGKNLRYLALKTPWEEANLELNVECALLDTIVSRWTAQQTEVVIAHFIGKTQEQIAESLNISQPGVRKRILSAHAYEMELMLTRFEQLIKKYYNPVGL